MTDITAADFDLPEREVDVLDFSEDMKFILSLKDQIMGWNMQPERVIMSEEQFQELVEYGRQLRDE
jgi:hypothetical protein